MPTFGEVSDRPEGGPKVMAPRRSKTPSRWNAMLPALALFLWRRLRRRPGLYLLRSIAGRAMAHGRRGIGDQFFDWLELFRHDQPAVKIARRYFGSPRSQFNCAGQRDPPWTYRTRALIFNHRRQVFRALAAERQRAPAFMGSLRVDHRIATIVDCECGLRYMRSALAAQDNQIGHVCCSCGNVIGAWNGPYELIFEPEDSPPPIVTRV